MVKKVSFLIDPSPPWQTSKSCVYFCIFYRNNFYLKNELFLIIKDHSPVMGKKDMKTHDQHKQTLAECLNRTLIHNNGG